MRVRIVRTVTRPSTLPDASAKQPWLNVGALPYAAPRMLCFMLSPIVLALGVFGPIERQAVAYRPVRKVNAIDRTHRYRAPVLVQVYRRAIDRPSRYEGVKLVRRLGPATILIAVLAPAKLAAFRRINAPKPNARPVNFERVAVDNAGLPGQIIGER
jgi:hypothetical protein